MRKVAVQTHRRPLPGREKFCPDHNMERQNHVGNNQKGESGKAIEGL